jgi:hypothetical protein
MFLVSAFHLFVHHKLDGSVRNTKESRKKSFVETFNTFVAVSLDQRINYSTKNRNEPFSPLSTGPSFTFEREFGNFRKLPVAFLL